MRKRFLLVENAMAGAWRRGLAGEVVDLLQAAGASVERCSGDVQEVRRSIAAAARGGHYDAVIAAGGDGTIRHAACAVAGTNMPLGVIPLGTANVLAHEIGLPRRPRPLAQVLQAGPTETIAAPMVNGEVFLLMAGAGFDGRVIEALSHAVKGRVGKLAFAGPLARALARRPDVLDVRIDGTLHRAGWVVITNARHYGGRFVMAPATSVREAGLSAVLFDTPDRGTLVGSLLALAAGRLATCRHVRLLACAHVEVSAPAPVPVQVDGDVSGATPLVVQADGGPRLSLIVPSPAGSEAER